MEMTCIYLIHLHMNEKENNIKTTRRTSNPDYKEQMELQNEIICN